MCDVSVRDIFPEQPTLESREFRGFSGADAEEQFDATKVVAVHFGNLVVHLLRWVLNAEAAIAELDVCYCDGIEICRCRSRSACNQPDRKIMSWAWIAFNRIWRNMAPVIVASKQVRFVGFNYLRAPRVCTYNTVTTGKPSYWPSRGVFFAYVWHKPGGDAKFPALMSCIFSDILLSINLSTAACIDLPSYLSLGHGTRPRIEANPRFPKTFWDMAVYSSMESSTLIRSRPSMILISL
jgi:hypothetical protein